VKGKREKRAAMGIARSFDVGVVHRFASQSQASWWSCRLGHVVMPNRAGRVMPIYIIPADYCMTYIRIPAGAGLIMIHVKSLSSRRFRNQPFLAQHMCF